VWKVVETEAGEIRMAEKKEKAKKEKDNESEENG